MVPTCMCCIYTFSKRVTPCIINCYYYDLESDSILITSKFSLHLLFIIGVILITMKVPRNFQIKVSVQTLI